MNVFNLSGGYLMGITKISAKEIEERLKNTEQLYDALLYLEQLSHTTLEEMLEYILEIGVSITNSKMGYIVRYNEDLKMFTDFTWSKDAKDSCKIENQQIEYRLEETGLWGEVIRQKKPIITNKYAKSPNAQGRLNGQIPFHRHLNVPVLVNGKIIALLGVGNKEVTYHEYDVKNLVLLLGIGLKNLAHVENVKKVAESEKRFRGTFDQAAVAICYAGEGGNFLKVNKKACDILGYSNDEMLRLNFMDITYHEDLHDYDFLKKKLLEGQTNSLSYEKRYVKKDGTIVWLDIALSLVNDVGGKWLYFITAQDSTERKQAEQILSETQAILQAAMDNSQAGIAIVDAPCGKLRYVNKAGQIIIHKSHDKLNGNVDIKNYIASWNIIHHDGTPFQEDEGPLARALHYGESCSNEFIIKQEGFEDHIVWANVAPVRNESGEIKAGIVIFLDISERKHIEEALRRAKDAAERANVAKSQFLANMSHEIRTPMTGIIGMTDLALMTELTEEQREFLEIVKSSTRSLLQVLNDILDYSKVEAGKLDLEKVEFPLTDVLNEVVALFSVVAQQKGLSIQSKVRPEIPSILIGDSFRLRQVLSNLIGNAVKFTVYGRVEIETSCVYLNAEEIKLKFVISDTGIGIAKDKLDLLFRSFSQVDDSNTRQFGGTGLGLAISKKLTELMNGEIWVESKVGRGSKFCFTALFGLGQEQNLKKMENANQIFLQAKTNKQVLLVEDDEVSRKIVSLILLKKGLEVYIAKNGKEAVEMVEKQNFDLIFMDINMPYMDGYSAVTLIRRQEEMLNRHIPIIALTAYALKGDREKCLAIGMDDYLSKPVDINALNIVIDHWLDSPTN